MFVRQQPALVRAAHESGHGAAATELPAWDLSDLYTGMDDPALSADLAKGENDARAFAARYEGKLGAQIAADPAALGEAIGQCEAINERLGRVASYVSLLYSSDMSNVRAGKFRADSFDRINAISSVMIFFELELNTLEDDLLERGLKTGEGARYRPWVERVRRFRPHQVSDELERFLHDQSVVGTGAWMRLFDETLAGLTFEVRGETLSCEAALHRMSSPDASVRADAAAALTKVFKANGRLFTLILNTLIKEKEIEDRWRKYPSPAAARHLANEVEPEVVEALVTAVRSYYPKLSHRYYALKARWLGKTQLDHWDRNAPLSEVALPAIAWDEARETVLGAYGTFAPKMAQIARRFFDSHWIDAALRPGKATGAFAHSTVPSVHPYVLLNYQGSPRDVMTLAHELGHGVHQTLAGAKQGYFLSHTPLTIAETASVFGEMLTFQALLARTSDAAARRALLAGKVEDMLNTVVRQIAFHTFETELHARRREGEFTEQNIGELWLKVQAESLGPAIRQNEGYETYWTYISHFVHAPFYVYAYAFGDCLVNALYARYEAEPSGFTDKYFALLSAGGSMGHKALLAPFGLDASDPAFWAQGLERISGMIDQLEAEGG